MLFQLIIISGILIILLLLLIYYIKPMKKWLKFNESWYELKLHKVPMTYGRYLYNKFNLWSLGMPSNTLFKEYIRVFDTSNDIKFEEIIKTYRSVASSIERKLNLHKNRYVLDSLNLFRVGGNYIITGDISKIFHILQKSYKIDTESVLQTQLKKNTDVKVYEEIRDLLKSVIDETIISFKNYPVDTNDDKLNSKNKEERELLISYVIDDFRNRLKLRQAYLISEVGVKYSKKKLNIFPDFIDFHIKKNNKPTVNRPSFKKIFLDITLFNRLVSSYIKGKQAGLSLELSDLSLYFDKDGDFELIIDILIKTKQFDFKDELKEIEKYIYVDNNIEETLAHLIKARKVNPETSLEDLEEHISLGGDAGVFVNSIIRAHYGKVVVLPSDLNKYFSNGGNVETLISALIKLKKENININFDDLSTLKLEGGNIEQIIDDIVRAKYLGLTIELDDVKSYLSQGLDFHKLVDILIKNEAFGLNIDIKDLKSLARINVDLDILYRSLSLDKRTELGVSKEKLMDLQTTGIDMFNYVMALKLNKDNKFDINPLDFEIDFLANRNVLPVLLEMARTKNTDNALSYGFGILLDKFGHNISEVVDWALNPQVLTMELDHIVTRNAFSIKPTVNVMVKGKIYKYTKGAKEDVLKARVNEAFISEVELIESYEKVLHHLGEISNRVFRRLIAQMDKADYEYYDSIDQKDIEYNNDREAKLNEQSAYEILDISVQNVEIGTDILSTLKKEIAELEYIISTSKSRERRVLALAQAAETKAKLVESEAELKKGLAEAFRNGVLNSANEYHKHELLHGDKHEEHFKEDSSHDLHDSGH